MSDPIADAAAQMSDAAPSSTEPGAIQNGDTFSGALSGVAVVMPVTGNMLVNAALLVDAPAIDAPAVEPEADELPRESHLMLLEAKIAAFRAKLDNAERVALDEFEAIVGHVKAVL